MSIEIRQTVGLDRYAEKVYLVPAVLRTNSSGLPFEKRVIASNPVQCAGTTTAGWTVLMSATNIAVLGLRFNGLAFTSIPTAER